MSKYKVGDELIIIKNPDEEMKKLQTRSKLTVDDDIATFSWGLRILKKEYNAPEITLTVENVKGEINKVYAVCSGNEKDFDEEMVLEKALLKAYTEELMKITTLRSKNLTDF